MTQSAPLKRVVSINDEALPDDTSAEREIDYIDIGSVGTGHLVEEPTQMAFGDAPSRARRIVRRGDTIVSTVRTYLKAVLPIDSDLDGKIASTGFAVVRPAGIDPRYVGWVLQSEPFVNEVVSRSVGVSYPAINPSQLGSIHVPTPPTDEQRRIADFLDTETARIDALIEARERHRKVLDERLSSTIDLAVTQGLGDGAGCAVSRSVWYGSRPPHWRDGKVRFLVSRLGSGKTPRGGSEVYVDSGVAFLRSQNVLNGSLSLDDVVFVDEAVHREMSDTQVHAGDVLLNITGASIGRVAIFDEPDLPANVNQHVSVLRPVPGVEPRWLSYVLSSHTVQEQIWLAQSGAAQGGLPASDQGDIELLVPPHEEQVAIANHLDRTTSRLHAAVEAIDRQNTLLSEYRRALITAAVTGQLDQAKLNSSRPVDDDLQAEVPT